MRKKSLLLIVVFAAIFSISAGAYGASSNDYLIYGNSNDFEIAYPKDWSMKEGVMGTTVMFLSQLENQNDKFRENVNIVVQDLSKQPMSLDEYTNLSLMQLKRIITDINITTSEKTKLANCDAYMVVYTGKQGQYNLKLMQIWTIKNNNAYIITYTAENIGFDKYGELVNPMVNSFVIK